MDIQSLFGGGSGNTLNIAAQSSTISPVGDVGQLVAIGARGALIVAGLAVLFFLITGALDWLMAGSDKGKVEQGRNKIMNAIIGLAILASVFAVYAIVLRFFGIDDRIQLNGAGGTSTTGGGGSSSGASTCAGGVPIGSIVNDGGAGGYCTGGGAARVQCVGPGEGPSAFPYPHFEPCSCTSGTKVSGYTFRNC